MTALPHRGTLVVRADAGPDIGMGHVMRCLALASGWREQGGEVRWLGRFGSPVLRARLEGQGFVCKTLDDISESERMSLFLDYLNRNAVCNGWVVLDGYKFDVECQRMVRRSGWPLLVLDDQADRPLYEADLLLNQNLDADRLVYRTHPETVLLRGTRYALLREEFRDDQENLSPEQAEPKHILLMMGGADPDNVTCRILAALKQTGRTDLQVTVVAGAVNPHLQVIREMLSQMPFPGELLVSVENMVPLMRRAGLAVVGAGSSCWELARLGVPMATVVLAENQQGVAAALAVHGAAVNLGVPSGWGDDEPVGQLTTLLADSARMSRLGEKAGGLVDGRGVMRVLAMMDLTAMRIRPVAENDCERIFAWANEPGARAASFHSAPIAREAHERWFAARLADPCSHIYVVESAIGMPMGPVRFERQGRESFISVSLDVQFRGLGLAVRLLVRACREYLRQQVGVIIALIRQDNPVSRQTFTKAGFVMLGETVQNGIPAWRLLYQEEGRA